MPTPTPATGTGNTNARWSPQQISRWRSRQGGGTTNRPVTPRQPRTIASNPISSDSSSRVMGAGMQRPASIPTKVTPSSMPNPGQTAGIASIVPQPGSGMAMQGLPSEASIMSQLPAQSYGQPASYNMPDQGTNTQQQGLASQWNSMPQGTPVGMIPQVSAQKPQLDPAMMAALQRRLSGNDAISPIQQLRG